MVVVGLDEVESGLPLVDGAGAVEVAGTVEESGTVDGLSIEEVLGTSLEVGGTVEVSGIVKDELFPSPPLIRLVGGLSQEARSSSGTNSRVF